MGRALVTGAGGQVGAELVAVLRGVYGESSVLSTDLRPDGVLSDTGPFEQLDCTDVRALAEAVERFAPDTIYHLAAILSVRAEDQPQKAYGVNLGGLFNVLEVARESGTAVFFPSSIAAFGPSTPQDPAPQDTIQRPTSMYGITKVAGELLCDYYHDCFGVDTRGVRFPGLISHVVEPGGGTTDYAVEIFHHAIEQGRYTCFLRPDTPMDMMYMPDAVRAAMELMEADPKRLVHRNAFNLAAIQLTPETLAAEIARHIPGFTIDYEVDLRRQGIADSWPRRVDDSAARHEWGWDHEYTLDSMTTAMIAQLRRHGD